MMAQTLKTSGDTASQQETRQRAEYTVTETAREHNGGTRSEQAARIIEQLKANHADAVASGLGSPDLEEFHRLVVDSVSEAEDPRARFAEITRLLSERRKSLSTPKGTEPSVPEVRVHAVDLQGETPVAVRDSLTRYDLGIDFSFPAEDIAAGLQTVLRDGVDGGRWSRVDTSLTPLEIAEQAIRRAVLGQLAGLDTNPRDAAESLHTAIDDTQAEHLADIAGFPQQQARKAEAFSTAVYATVRALAMTDDVQGTALGLRTMLDMCIAEARA